MPFNTKYKAAFVHLTVSVVCFRVHLAVQSLTYFTITTPPCGGGGSLPEFFYRTKSNVVVVDSPQYKSWCFLAARFTEAIFSKFHLY